MTGTRLFCLNETLARQFLRLVAKKLEAPRPDRLFWFLKTANQNQSKIIASPWRIFSCALFCVFFPNETFLRRDLADLDFSQDSSNFSVPSFSDKHLMSWLMLSDPIRRYVPVWNGLLQYSVCLRVKALPLVWNWLSNWNGFEMQENAF